MFQEGLKNGMNEYCRIQFSLVFDKQQSYILLKAVFKRESGVGFNHLIDSGHQTMKHKLYAGAFDHPNNVTCNKVPSLQDLPAGLQVLHVPVIEEIFKRGNIHKISLRYNAEKVIQEGVNDPLGFAQTEKLHKHNLFARIGQVYRIDVYVEVSDFFRQALQKLQGNFGAEKARPPFHEYFSREGNYM